MTLSAAVVPDYTGANLSTLVPALMSEPGSRPAWLPSPLADAEQVVLLVVDGLGWLQLQERLDLAPHLAPMTGGAITSVAPTTTATALTSLVVGAPPCQHGVLGYRVAVDGPQGIEVMNVLKWRTPAGDARPFVDPLTFQVLAPFAGRPVPVVSRSEFAGTAFTDAHQRGARQIGWASASGLAVETRRLLAAGEPFVYTYYDAVDRIAHIHGLGDHYDAELVAVDRIIADLVEMLPAGAALAVTADHGQVEVGPRAAVIDPRIAAEVELISGEARFRWLHARDRSPEGVQALADLVESIYAGEAWVATFDQVVAAGWLGGEVGPQFRSRLGDVALVPFEPVAYLDSADAGDAKLACRHGSLTADEMLVPLVAVAGKM